MARNISEIMVDPIFHLALSGGFEDISDPTHTTRNLAGMAIEAYEQGLMDEDSSLPLATYELPWCPTVEATVSFSEERLNGILLRDRDYALNALVVPRQPVFSVESIMRAPIGSRDLIVVSKPAPVNRSLNSRSYRIFDGEHDTEIGNISADLAEDARRFFVNHQAFRVYMDLAMSTTPRLKAV